MPVYIYVIGRWDGPVKVGISDKPHRRVSAIQTGCHFPIELFYSYPCPSRSEAERHERFFHECYNEKRLTGEWFDLHAELAIEGIQNGFAFDEMNAEAQLQVAPHLRAQQ